MSSSWTQKSRPASDRSATPELDSVVLFLERVENQMTRIDGAAVIVADQPGGGQREEGRFLDSSLEAIWNGTRYASLGRIAFVITGRSHRYRVAQLADVITSCSLSMVSGEDRHAPKIFEHVVSLLAGSEDRKGGIGLKLHPDLRYANLYHWLLGDTHWWKSNMGMPLPRQDMLYSTSALEV